MPRPALVIDAAATSRAARVGWEDLRRAWRADRGQVLWLLLWAPFWIAAETPRPSLPGAWPAHDAPVPPTPAGTWLAQRIDAFTRRFRLTWAAGAMLRGITLSLLALAAWALAATLTVISPPGWAAVIALLVTGIIAGGVYGWITRPHRMQVAHMLDRTFALEERIITAFDRQPDLSPVSRLQLADAANMLDEVAREIPRTAFIPIRELALCLVAAGALVTAVLANVPQEPVDPPGRSPVAGFIPASERLAVNENSLAQQQPGDQPTVDQATLAEIQEEARAAETARDDLATVGEALRDTAITQPAADAIAAGDYRAAADSLRSAAQAASAMPEEERNALADNLDAAADQIEESNPDLAQAARDAADALREGGPAAEEALNDLADQIDDTGSQAQQPGGSSPNLDESQAPGDDTEGAGQGSEAGGGQGGTSGEEPATGAGTDPGAGADAAPGVADSPAGSDPSAAGSEGEGQSSEGEAGGQEPQDGEGSSASAEDGAPANDPSSGSAGQQQDMAGAPDEETSASQGSGAGTGQTNANDQSESEGPVESSEGEQGEPEAEVPQEGEAGDPPPSREDRGEEDDGTGSTVPGGTSIELEGTSDENVPSGGTGGSTSLGSGSGSSTSSGSGGQGEVGVAGPDSNRVPDALRDVVQDFFDGPTP